VVAPVRRVEPEGTIRMRFFFWAFLVAKKEDEKMLIDRIIVLYVNEQCG
jgi:hypothetical protein